MFAERMVRVATGSELNVAEGPRHGPPLLLFHGLGRLWQDFTPLLPELTVRWTVSGIDHRGHGKSARVAGRYTIADYVADAVALVRGASEPVVLVGHSLGALVALGVAGRVPTMVRAAVLLDPPGIGFLAGARATPYHAMWVGMRKLAGTGPVAEVARRLAELRLPSGNPGETVRLGDVRDAAALRFMARCLQSLDPDTLAPVIEGRWLAGFDLNATVAAARCPVLLVVCDPARGGMLPASDADPLAATLPDCTRVNLLDIGHLLHWQDSAATARLLHAFLASL